jgi:hypothetical protein
MKINVCPGCLGGLTHTHAWRARKPIFQAHPPASHPPPPRRPFPPQTPTPQRGHPCPVAQASLPRRSNRGPLSPSLRSQATAGLDAHSSGDPSPEARRLPRTSTRSISVPSHGLTRRSSVAAAAPSPPRPATSGTCRVSRETSRAHRQLSAFLGRNSSLLLPPPVEDRAGRLIPERPGSAPDLRRVSSLRPSPFTPDHHPGAAVETPARHLLADSCSPPLQQTRCPRRTRNRRRAFGKQPADHLDAAPPSGPPSCTPH